MAPQESAALLQLITAAVTPVVMISAAALLIVGINSKHQSMSDRMRYLANEFRQASTVESRRSEIVRQIGVFERRIRLTGSAHRILYLAIVLFLVTVLLIVLAPAALTWIPAAYVLFVAGIALMLAAVVFELLELQLANRTLDLEVSPLVRPPSSITAAKAPAERG